MKESIFFINAHPDDLIGSAGTAFLLADTGKFDLHVLDLTRGERGLVTSGISLEECAKIRVAEEERSCALLGVKPVFLGEIDGDTFASKETCLRTAELFRKNQPRAIFTHWPVDVHPDHIVCFTVVIKALLLAGLKSEIYFFEESIQTLDLNVRFYVPFDQGIMDRKTQLIHQYACQNCDRMAERKLCEARYHGWKAGADFAECFGFYERPIPGQKSVLEEISAVRP